MNDNDIAQAVSNALSKYTRIAPDVAPQATPVASQQQGNDSLDAIIAKALAQQIVVATPGESVTASNGTFATMDEAIAAAVLAQIQYRHCSMQDRGNFIQGIRDVFLQDDVLQAISLMAVEETGMGNYEDKFTKNRLAALKTPGVDRVRA